MNYIRGFGLWQVKIVKKIKYESVEMYKPVQALLHFKGVFKLIDTLGGA